jgi:hypothetical protein
MVKGRLLAGGLLILLVGGWAPAMAAPQAPPPIPQPTPDAQPDAQFEAQKSTFLAMPEADRKAAQDALGWLGLYNGAIDGTFGKRTRDSILAFQQSISATPDGIVGPTELQTLKASAQRARTAVDFAQVDDLISGVRIGAPLKLLTKLKPASAETTLESGDGALSLTLAERAPAPVAGAPAANDDAGLGALYAQLTAEASGRKITYKALKADDFLVVAGEQGGDKFYSRFARAPAGWPQGPSLRGFTFVYPASKAGEFDKLSLAVANGFDPFADTPASHGAAALRAQSARSTVDVVRVATGAPALGGPVVVPLPGALVTGLSPGARPTPTPIPTPTEVTATALYVAPGQALTALPAGKCNDPRVDGKPAKLLRADAATGLTLLGGDFAAAAPPPKPAAGVSDLLVLSLAPAAGGKSTLEASPGALAPLADGRSAVLAALGQSVGGAPAFDRSGALAGVVAALATQPRRIGVVALDEPRALIGVEAIAAFLALAPATAPTQTPALDAGAVAAAARGAIAQVVCKP